MGAEMSCCSDVPSSARDSPHTVAAARTLKAGCAADRATNDGEAGDWVDERGAGKEKAKVGSLQLRQLVTGQQLQAAVSRDAVIAEICTRTCFEHLPGTGALLTRPPVTRHLPACANPTVA